MKECGCHGTNENCTFCNGSGYRQIQPATRIVARENIELNPTRFVLTTDLSTAFAC